MSQVIIHVLKAENDGGNVAFWEISCGPDIIHASSTVAFVAGLVDWKATNGHSKMMPSWSLGPSRKEGNK